MFVCVCVCAWIIYVVVLISTGLNVLLEDADLTSWYNSPNMTANSQHGSLVIRKDNKTLTVHLSSGMQYLAEFYKSADNVLQNNSASGVLTIMKSIISLISYLMEASFTRHCCPS